MLRCLCVGRAQRKGAVSVNRPESPAAQKREQALEAGCHGATTEGRELSAAQDRCPFCGVVRGTPHRDGCNTIPDRSAAYRFNQVDVFDALMDERERQDIKWGGTPGIDRRDD